MNLSELQAEHKLWVEHNFPDQLPHEPLLGLVEELGELSHAHLKHEQGIRGYTRAKYLNEAADAVGDFVIYLASYCNRNGLNLEWCVRDAWDQVQQRDWKASPSDGQTGDHSVSTTERD